MFVNYLDRRFLSERIQQPSLPLNDPLYFRLSGQEQGEFTRLVTYFQLTDDRNKRNFGLSTFIKHISLVHKFVVKEDGNDLLRGVISGILFGQGFLLINTDRLKRLMHRSKSCVNGCFQKLGFSVYRSMQDLNGFFDQNLPGLAINWINPRHWCIRKASDDTPVCFISGLSMDICKKYHFPIDAYENEEEIKPDIKEKEKDKLKEEVIEFYRDIRSLLNRPCLGMMKNP